MSIFHFKEFSVQQNASAMKVGTDSILLGSWVDLDLENSILDIGTGTGLLGLMLAQRSDALQIDAVEIEEQAYIEAVTNFENSPWSDRLFCYHASIQEFSVEMDEKYDLIVANPPYFNPDSIVSSRSVARQTHTLSHLSLLKSTKRLLAQHGKAAFVIPFEMESFFVELAHNLSLFALKVTRIKDTENADFKRSLLLFGLKQTKLSVNELVLKNADSTYSRQFIELTKDFYLGLEK
jgi:tRNA1Val (adenine37-N6)-methyltransferase